MEARGRTFEHLFLAGLNRDVFPRGVREDPLLPDDLRRVLQRVIPDVPVKLGGFDEERWLFAHLLSSSPAVTLSWQSVDEDGKAVSASPLLRDAAEAPRVPPLWSREAVRQGPRTAAERAVLAGLHGSRADLALVLPLALGGGSPNTLAAARLAVLNEIDPDLRTPEGRAARARLGPWFGFVGAAGVQSSDPRRRDLFVTHLEGMAACPWQHFLQRLLRLEPTPDPLQMAPGSDPLLLGNLVHAVLERIVKEAGPAAGAAGDPTADPSSSPGRRRRTSGVSWRRRRPGCWPEEGIFLSGLARALAEQVAPRLDAAHGSDWAEGPVPVLSVEDEGDLQVLDAQGRPRSVRFRADRVDLLEDGALRRTDYKTGKPISKAKKEEARHKAFLERVRSGANLQGVAYHLSRREPVGRYLYLRPDVEARVFRGRTGGPGPDRSFRVRGPRRAGRPGTRARSFRGWWTRPAATSPAAARCARWPRPASAATPAPGSACSNGRTGRRGARDLPPEESSLLEVWRLPAKNRDEEPAE